jgi:hypothetical protein
VSASAIHDDRTADFQVRVQGRIKETDARQTGKDVSRHQIGAVLVCRGSAIGAIMANLPA